MKMNLRIMSIKCGSCYGCVCVVVWIRRVEEGCREEDVNVQGLGL